jgi:hypothetical protein
MGSVTLFSLMVGALGLQATALGLSVRSQEQQQAKQQDEEETLTPYESQETVLSTGSTKSRRDRKDKDPRLVGWEFKIVRANRDLFRDPAMMKKLCDEEAIAGWILLEKLDDQRIRFKRPIAMREVIKAEMLSFDPYRTHYGPTGNGRAIVIGLAAITAILLPALLGFGLVMSLPNHLLQQQNQK